LQNAEVTSFEMNNSELNVVGVEINIGVIELETDT
jgi:hypothetical protein